MDLAYLILNLEDSLREAKKGESRYLLDALENLQPHVEDCIYKLKEKRDKWK